MEQDKTSTSRSSTERSIPKVEQSIESPSDEVTDLTSDHLQLLKMFKIKRRWIAILFLIPSLAAIFSNIEYAIVFQEMQRNNEFSPQTIQRFFIFIGIYISLIIIGGCIFYIIIRFLLMFDFIDNRRWRFILATHKDSRWFDPDVLCIFLSFIPTFSLVFFLNSPEYFLYLVFGLCLKKILLMETSLKLSIIGFSLFIAIRQNLGGFYPYANAYYRFKKWIETTRKGEPISIWTLIKGFQDLKRQFIYYDLAFGEFWNDFIEGLLFIAHFGSFKNEQQLSGDISNLLKEMYEMDTLYNQNYRSILAVVECKHQKLENLDQRKYLQRNIPFFTRLMQYLIQPAFVVRLLQPIFYAVLSVIVILVAIFR